MAKFNLDTEDDGEPDFLLIGICSHAKAYRLCWSLNQVMPLKLVNIDQPIVITNPRKKTSVSFEVYNCADEESRINYYLICNKSGDGYLLPEFKHVDYLLMLKENVYININDEIARVKRSDQVLTAFAIIPEEIRSMENLLF